WDFSARSVSKTRVEEPRVVDAELPHCWIIRHHFRRVFGRDTHRAFGRQDVETVRVKNNSTLGGSLYGVPEIVDGIVIHFIQFYCRRVPLGFVSDNRTPIPFQIDCDWPTAVYGCVSSSAFFIILNHQASFRKFPELCVSSGCRVAANQTEFI